MSVKQKRKLVCGMGAFTMCLMLVGCGHEHTWIEATCTESKKCSECDATEGEPLGHTWVEATCAEPKHCSVCGESEGEALEHTWVDATCAEPKHCSVCGESEGEALAHTWVDANFQTPKTCSVCGATEGDPIVGCFEEYGYPCNEKLNTPFGFDLPTYQNPDLKTTLECEFKDYSCFVEDDNFEALEGYVWQRVTLSIICWDENWFDYGFNGLTAGIGDYYDDKGFMLSSNNDDGTQTRNFNGIDYDECYVYAEQDDTGDPDTDYWHNDKNDPYGTRTITYTLYMRVPEGYDGNVVYVRNIADFPYDGVEDHATYEEPGFGNPETYHSLRLPPAIPE